MSSADGRTSLPRRTLRRATPGAFRRPAAMGQAGPALVIAMASPVTPCGGSPHPTVLDPWAPTDHPAAFGGDVGGTDDVPVPRYHRTGRRAFLRRGKPACRHAFRLVAASNHSSE